MALTSPGVQVSVIDESFYTPAEPGTIPLFIVASASNKLNGAGTGTAQGTLASNAGKVYLITSQRDLVDTFGEPSFQVDSNNNPIHAGELNEYGLQAAYSYLGVSNSAFVVRANLDLDLLSPQSSQPGGEPKDGTFWLDTRSSTYGVFQWDGRSAVNGGQTFVSKQPTVILDSANIDAGAPKAAFGAIGDYALVPGADILTDAEIADALQNADQADSHVLTLWYKSRFAADGVNAGVATWVKVGSAGWKAAWPTVQGTGSASADGVNIDINGASVVTTGTTLASLAADIDGAAIPGVSARVVDNKLQIFATTTAIDSIEIEATSDAAVLTAAGLTAGVYYTPAMTIAPHTSVPAYKTRDTEPRPTGSVWVKSTEPNGGARWRLKIYNANTQLWDAVDAPIYSSNQAALAALDRSGGGKNLSLDTAYVQANIQDSYAGGQVNIADFRVMRRRATGETVIKSKIFADGDLTADDYEFQLSESVAGSATLVTKLIQVTLTGTNDADAIRGAINSPAQINGADQGPFTNIVATVEAVTDTTSRIVISHKLGGEMLFGDWTANIPGDLVDQLELAAIANNVYFVGSSDLTHDYIASNWIPLTITPDTSTKVRQSYYISASNPETLAADGELWYSSIVDEVDMMIHNGTTWVGYKNFSPAYANTNPTGPIVSASEPTTQSDGTDLVEGDLWIDTSDLENYPLVKRYNADFGRFDSVDTSDQTSENGILFADARAGKTGGSSNSAPSGTIEELLVSDFLDFDAPDPALYPRGMLLWNLRRSGFNVKKMVRNYVDVNSDNIRFNNNEAMTNYYPHRWVTESGNQADGSGSFGRKAQRKVVQQALQALVNSNQDIRDTEVRNFNLIACPGYPELIGEMVSLNYDRGLTAFVVGDTPARLTPDATTINDWGNNVALALEDNDKGLVSYDEYLGVFYPWGFTSDNAGRDIAVPPSHMICRMIALSDQVSYPWFAPAGTRRGGITNATAVGYVSAEGEFVSVALNEGQRDTLYNVKVNPITFFTGAGLVNFGQKTRARNASSLDRINVARLVVYLRSQLNKLAKPYIFEPNDKITRDEIKQQVESLLIELVGQRALYDFLVVCDESNNTPNRIDRNELYVDIAIEPVKAVEFIYIPVRLKNTGEIAGL
jgi:hypothetical protein